MKRIIEYDIEPFNTDWQLIEMPKGSQILRAGPVFQYVGRDNPSAVIWALVTESNERISRRFHYIATDIGITKSDFPEGMGVYVDTVVNEDEVIHIFDGGEFPLP